jgi:negative modulator of initiation of replication
MKYIEVDEELYRYIAGKTESIGESASDILRRLLGLSVGAKVQLPPQSISQPGLESTVATVTSAPTHKLVEDFATLISDHKLAQQKGAVGRFLFVLESLYKAAPAQFEQVLQIQGRDRLYFATSKEALLQASESANPKEIGNSGFWVTSNNNTAKKRAILSEVLVQFGCDPELATILAAKV